MAFHSELSRIGVVIPALNEAEALPGVLKRLRGLGLGHIRVVDNGSTDGTVAVAEAGGAEVMREPRRGYGQACWSGLQNLPEGVEWILFCDADGSDDLEKLPAFFERMGDHDFILGDRRATDKSSRTLTVPQRWGNALATTLIHVGWGRHYDDLGPMRLIRRTALERIAMEDRGFGWTIEMQIRAVEWGLRIAEIPVRSRERQGGESKISGTVRGVVMAGSIILGTWAKFFLRKPSVQNTLRWVSAVFLFLGAAAMVPFGDFEKFGVLPGFWIGVGLISIGYVVSWALRSITWGWLMFVAVGVRFILLPMFPGDDVWRYLWEGMIQNQGFNPYVLSPAAVELAHLRTPWWNLIQHPEITAVYPPLTQALMRLAALAPGWWLLKLMIVAADLAVVVLLSWKSGARAASFYAWCPLVIYVFAGGGHFDAWMLLAMVAGWILWDGGHWRWAVLALGVACGIKYVAAPLLAWMIWRLFRSGPGCGLKNFQKALVALALAALPTVLAVGLLPSPHDPRHWVPGDFALYARSADLIPRLVGDLWEGSLRLNTLYVLPVALIGIWAVWKCQKLDQMATVWFGGLLFFSPLVHAWYFVWAMPFAAFTGSLAWRVMGVTGFLYFLLQQRAFEEQDWMLAWPVLLVMWSPLIMGALGQMTKGRV